MSTDYLDGPNPAEIEIAYQPWANKRVCTLLPNDPLLAIWLSTLQWKLPWQIASRSPPKNLNPALF